MDHMEHFNYLLRNPFFLHRSHKSNKLSHASLPETSVSYKSKIRTARVPTLSGNCSIKKETGVNLITSSNIQTQCCYPTVEKSEREKSITGQRPSQFFISLFPIRSHLKLKHNKSTGFSLTTFERTREEQLLNSSGRERDTNTKNNDNIEMNMFNYQSDSMKIYNSKPYIIDKNQNKRYEFFQTFRFSFRPKERKQLVLPHTDCNVMPDFWRYAYSSPKRFDCESQMMTQFEKFIHSKTKKKIIEERIKFKVK